MIEAMSAPIFDVVASVGDCIVDNRSQHWIARAGRNRAEMKGQLLRFCDSSVPAQEAEFLGTGTAA